MNTNETCDVTLRISHRDLKGESTLSDSVQEHTRCLFTISLWNSNNYVIFMIPVSKIKKNISLSKMKKDNRRLKFLFRFFWRFFKDIRTVICLDSICYKNDPFADSIQQIDTTLGDYFTFAPHLRGLLSVGFCMKAETYRLDGNFIEPSIGVLWQTCLDLKELLRIDVGLTTCWKQSSDDTGYYRDAPLSWNLDMVIWDGSLSAREDFSIFDFSLPIQTCSYCYVTPRSSFVPESLLPFKSFSLQTWTCILTVILVLYFSLYAFHRSQWTLFGHFYDARERHAFEHASAAYYLYSFLVVGSPSQLLLGRFATGKILFLVVSFFILIIITVFQSEMTTLLSKQVRYPEIDTLEDLSRSNLYIQTTDLEASSNFLQGNPSFESLKGKLTEGHFRYRELWLDYMKDLNVNISRSLDDTPDNMSSPHDGYLSRLPKRVFDVRSNLQSMMDSDAFEMTFSNLGSKYRSTIVVEELFHKKLRGKFHLVKECVLTYPMVLQVQKNSYLSDFFIKRINAYVEMGVVSQLAQTTELSLSPLNPSDKNDDDDDDDDVAPPPKAFTIQNLQSAFIGLIIGWILSCVVFGVEMVVDISKSGRGSKFVRRFE